MNKDKIVAALVAVARAAAKAAAVGAGVAALTVIANMVPEFGLNPAATGQVTAIVILARDALKTKGG